METLMLVLTNLYKSALTGTGGRYSFSIVTPLGVTVGSLMGVSHKTQNIIRYSASPAHAVPAPDRLVENHP